MKEALKIAKVVIPIGLAIYLMYETFKNPQQRAELWEAMQRANYLWVFISMCCAFLSHVIRARRWKYLLEPMGYKTRFWNAYHSVMSGYLINMAIPRAGEVSRAGLFAKAEDIPFDKTFGTIAAERVLDLLILLGITGITVLTQYEKVWGAMKQQWAERPTGEGMPLYVKGIIALAILGSGFFIAKRLGLLDKIKAFIQGIIEGLASVLTTPHKWAFLRDTALIWALYMAMFTVMYQCLPEAAELGLGAVLAGFVFGSFAVVLTPGGTGAYHIAIAFALGFYGIANSTGQTLGLLIWGSQTILIILLGFLSLLLMPIYNRGYKGHTALSAAQTS